MLLDLLNHRRAVRHFDADKLLDSTTVRHCLKQAQLAPSSSNLQLYEFYHITGKATLEALATACLSQQAATTATQMVVFVAVRIYTASALKRCLHWKAKICAVTARRTNWKNG